MCASKGWSAEARARAAIAAPRRLRGRDLARRRRLVRADGIRAALLLLQHRREVNAFATAVAGIISESNGAHGQSAGSAMEMLESTGKDGLDIWASRGGGAGGCNHDCPSNAASGEIGIFQIIEVHLV